MVSEVRPIVVHTIVHTTVQSNDLGTTVLAGFGALLAVAALAWQAWSFYLAGSRVSVEIRNGLKRGNAVATTASTPTPKELEGFAAQGFDEPIFSIKVYNAGRGATSIVDLDITFCDGGGGGVGNLVLDPPLPFRLQGESEQTWHFDAEHVRAVAHAFAAAMPDRSFRAVRGRAQIGGRKRIVVSENEAEVPHMPEAP
jgi:hypothetical protein